MMVLSMRMMTLTTAIINHGDGGWCPANSVTGGYCACTWWRGIEDQTKAPLKPSAYRNPQVIRSRCRSSKIPHKPSTTTKDKSSNRQAKLPLTPTQHTLVACKWAPRKHYFLTSPPPMDSLRSSPPADPNASSSDPPALLLGAPPRLLREAGDSMDPPPPPLLLPRAAASGNGGTSAAAAATGVAVGGIGTPAVASAATGAVAGSIGPPSPLRTP